MKFKPDAPDPRPATGGSGGPPKNAPGSCSGCGRATDYAQLSMYGARCAGCYSAFKTAHQSCPAMEDAEVAPTVPFAWAHRLRLREQRMANLTQAQRDAWRECFRLPLTFSCHEPIPEGFQRDAA